MCVGVYVSPNAGMALKNAEVDPDDLYHVVYGAAQLGNVYQAQVGKQDQEDFGVLPNGDPQVALRSPCGRKWCLKDEVQFIPFGFVSCKLSDKRPSDTQLLWVNYSVAAWQLIKSRWPDSGERSKKLLADSAAAGKNGLCLFHDVLLKPNTGACGQTGARLTTARQNSTTRHRTPYNLRFSPYAKTAAAK